MKTHYSERHHKPFYLVALTLSLKLDPGKVTWFALSGGNCPHKDAEG